MVTGKKNIFSGGRHLIIWRPPLNFYDDFIYWLPLNYLAAAT